MCENWIISLPAIMLIFISELQALFYELNAVLNSIYIYKMLFNNLFDGTLFLMEAINYYQYMKYSCQKCTGTIKQVFI